MARRFPGLLGIFLPHLVLGRGFGLLSSVSQHTGQQPPPRGPRLLSHSWVGTCLQPPSAPHSALLRFGGCSLHIPLPPQSPLLSVSSSQLLAWPSRLLPDLMPHFLSSKTRFPSSLSLSGIYQLLPQAHTCCFVLMSLLMFLLLPGTSCLIG